MVTCGLTMANLSQNTGIQERGIIMIVRASTKKGQRLLSTAAQNIGHHLTDVYINPSAEKQRAYSHCLEKYFNTRAHANFHICSKNTFKFTVAWCGVYTDDYDFNHKATFIETATNSYIIY